MILRRLSLVLFLLLRLQQPQGGVTVSPSGGGGITIVQHRSTFCSATTCALAFSSNNGASNLLVYFCGAQDSVLPNTTTDSNSNTITNFAAAGRSGTGAGGLRVDLVATSNSGANTVTCHTTSASRTYMAIYEVSGLPTRATDASNAGSQTGTNQTISTTGATTAANEVVFGFFFDAPNNDSMTVGAGYGSSEFINGGSGNESMLVEAKIVSSTGTQTATMTSGSNTNIIGQSISTFK